MNEQFNRFDSNRSYLAKMLHDGQIAFEEQVVAEDRLLICPYIDLTQPDSPRSPTQTYRLTEKDRHILAQYRTSKNT